MRRSTVFSSALLLTLITAATGCGSADPAVFEEPTDSGTASDTTKSDSLSPTDTATPEDTSGTDTATGTDTAVSDTTTTTDTGTVVTDTGTTVTDTGTTVTDTGTTVTDTGTTVTDTGTDTTPPLTLDAACDSWSSDFCSRYDTCSTFFVKYFFSDVATCKSRMKISCASHYGSTGSGYTPGKVVTCGKSYSTTSCVDLFAGTPSTECSVPGTVINGKACGSNAQCVSGFCAVDLGTTCGTCAPPPAEGAACLKAQCAEGMDCIGYSSTSAGVCQKEGRLGDVCSTSKPCSVLFSCYGGKCVTPGSGGETCDASQITAKDCDLGKGLYCEASTKLCKYLGTAKAGESCGALTTYTVCNGSGTCKMPTGSTTGTCMAAAADGASCDDTAGPQCMSPSFCLSSVCKLADPSACK